MLRLLIFLLGFGMLALGAISRFGIVQSLIDFQHQAVEVGPWVFSMDTTLVVVGVILILFSWILNGLAK